MESVNLTERYDGDDKFFTNSQNYFVKIGRRSKIVYWTKLEYYTWS